jgi:hypothetical protein
MLIIFVNFTKAYTKMNTYYFDIDYQNDTKFIEWRSIFFNLHL